MIDRLLKARFGPFIQRQNRLLLRYKLAYCWGFAALAGLILILVRDQTGWLPVAVLPLLALVAGVAALVIAACHGRAEPDFRRAACQIETKHPDLRGLLLTAVEQRMPPGEEPGYLQHRVVREAVEHSRKADWPAAIPESRLRWARAANWAAFACLAAVLWALRPMAQSETPTLFGRTRVNVTPGDISLERGNSLVVLARFAGPLPAGADLVINPNGEPARRIPLVKSLADPIFGGSVPDVSKDLLYHVEFGNRRSAEFRVTVFEHPRLERADVGLTFPEYTQMPSKRVEDTRRVSAVEGTRLDLTLQLNKPVVSARLVAKDQPDLALAVETNRAVASLDQFPLENSQTYALHLVDAEGRTNKVPSQFVIDVLKNRLPELRLASPRGDIRPSALEEVLFDGSVWDDFGVQTYGLAYNRIGEETKFIELGAGVPARERRGFQHLLPLEELAVVPDQLISWFVWADDIGPDGQTRRNTGDLFFGEIRPFDEIFREAPGMEGDSGGEPSEGSPSTRLAELQKQIINATWKLQRGQTGASAALRGDKPAEAPARAAPAPRYEEDVAVVRDSQAHALEQAEESREDTSDPRGKALWEAVGHQMDQALSHLKEAVKSPKPLSDALIAEQAAYQALLKLQAREYQVSRARRGGGQGGEGGNQRQIDQLDLTQSENRYETQRQARPQQSPERREQLQILNRLQELARRQQDLNERLQELQTALQEARTEAEREEIRRRLKRLQEDEQEMLADVDELRQRLDRPENQSRMNAERQQLDQTRSEVQRAAEAAGEGATSQALASGTRAQRQLQELRDELRKQNASEFSEEMRQMRSDARELARDQEEIAGRVDALDDTQRKTLSDSAERAELLDRLGQQSGRLTNLLDRATQVSQEAETAEPLLSKHLYDTLRKFTQDDTGNLKTLQEELLEKGLMTRRIYERLNDTSEAPGARSVDLTAEMLREGYLPQARETGERAGATLDELKRGVERAAESVLGDDTEALRMARQELDALTAELQREIDQANAGDPSRRQPSGASPEAAAGTEPGNQTAQATPGQPPGAAAGQNGEQPQPGARPGSQSAEAASQAASAQAGQTPGEGPPSPAQSASAQTGTDGSATGGEPSGSPQQRQLSDSPRRSADRDGRAGPLRADNRADGGGGRPSMDLAPLFDVEGGRWTGPITGEDFAPWSDRLRDVEEMLDLPELRNDVAQARETARATRLDFKRDLKKPDWAVVRLKVVRPLVEVRRQIGEELARRESNEALVPIDRDPVPNRYSELVRRYYEKLGSDR